MNNKDQDAAIFGMLFAAKEFINTVPTGPEMSDYELRHAYSCANAFRVQLDKYLSMREKQGSLQKPSPVLVS